MASTGRHSYDELLAQLRQALRSHDLGEVLRTLATMHELFPAQHPLTART